VAIALAGVGGGCRRVWSPQETVACSCSRTSKRQQRGCASPGLSHAVFSVSHGATGGYAGSEAAQSAAGCRCAAHRVPWPPSGMVVDV